MTIRTTMTAAVLGACALAAACSGSTPAASDPSQSSATGSASSGAVAPPSSAPSTAGTVEAAQAGDIPDNQAFVAFTFTAGGYKVKVPEGWARTDAATQVSFSDKFNTITLSSVAASSAPTESSAANTEVPQIQASTPGFTLDKISTVTRGAGPALLITYQADSPPDAVTGKAVRVAVERYEFWQNGTEGIVTLSGAVGADNVDPWKTITDSFAWTP